MLILDFGRKVVFSGFGVGARDGWERDKKLIVNWKLSSILEVVLHV